MAAPKNEKWERINEGYSVSSFGRVRSEDRCIKTENGQNRQFKGRILKFGFRKDGYVVVNITGFGSKKTWRVHQLVALHFIDNPNKYRCINHKNGLKNDNRVENLEWCTYSHNIKHAFENGLRSSVVNPEGKNGFSKKVIDLSDGKIYESVTQVIRTTDTGFSYSALKAMLNGQNPNKTKFQYV